MASAPDDGGAAAGRPHQLSELGPPGSGSSCARTWRATFETLRKHFSEWEIAEITWLNALENYYNLINVPLQIESDGFCAIAQARTA